MVYVYMIRNKFEIRATVFSVEIPSTELNRHAISKWMKRGENRADAPPLLYAFSCFAFCKEGTSPYRILTSNNMVHLFSCLHLSRNQDFTKSVSKYNVFLFTTTFSRQILKCDKGSKVAFNIGSETRAGIHVKC
jgi:hypothetical protein